MAGACFRRDDDAPPTPGHTTGIVDRPAVVDDACCVDVSGSTNPLVSTGMLSGGRLRRDDSRGNGADGIVCVEGSVIAESPVAVLVAINAARNKQERRDQ